MAEHPGERLRQGFMEPLGLSASALARGVGVHRSTVSRLLAGTQSLTPELAHRLGQYFDVPPRWWLEMQLDYDVALLHESGSVPTVQPLNLPKTVLLTPNGVLDLTAPPLQPHPEQVGVGANQPAELDGAQASSPTGVREVRFENGSLALLGSD